MPLQLNPANPILRIEPAMQEYAWGCPTAIPELLGLTPSGRPCAEAWFGAHPRASARVGQRTLAAVLAADPVGVLGHSVRDRFGGLPYMLKILSARRPLSVQVHPDRQQARAGYLDEEQRGIPVAAANRCYPDPNAKAELLVALTPFELLAGAKPLLEIAMALTQVPEIESLLPSMKDVGVARWLEAYLRLPEAMLQPALEAWVARDRGLVADIHRRTERVRPDRGLIFALLLCRHRLAPGDAMFLGPGLVHAYLGGTALEIAGNSDNVLRAGLTDKHVDAGELLEVARWSAAPVCSIPGGRRTSDADAFRLHRVRLGAGETRAHVANGPETVLALPHRSDVSVRISWREGKMDLRRGHACLVPHGVAYELDATGPADVYRAVVPV